MENSDDNEPQHKRPHLTTVPRNFTKNKDVPTINSTAFMFIADYLIVNFRCKMFHYIENHPFFKNADAGVVEVHKQLVEQTETQKHNLHNLEEKIKQLKERQKAYDDLLISVNQCWIQLINDLVLLGIQAGRGPDAMKALDNPDSPQGSLPLCPVEDIFLCKLIQKDSVEGSSIEEIINYVEEALALRQSSTFELLKLLQDTIDAQRERIDSVSQVLHGDVSSEDLIIQMSKIDDMMKEDADNLCEVIDALNVKQKESSRRKLEEDLAEMNRQIAELSSETGEEAVRKVEDELMVCKNMIKCTVCYDRLKEVVIVKCCHMFCSQCIQRNIELRHRKCHACGTAFGQSDVRSVKI
ncbi:hypothetical protein Lal_00048351 [Lupinus albus]|nr:hypothetical protein Lal_00048351 [Lupinus albus]